MPAYATRLICVIAALTAVCLATSPRLARAKDVDPTAAPPIWRIADADSTVFVLAALHYLPVDADWRSDAVGRAIDRAETFWFEADASSRAAREATAALLASAGAAPAGASLDAMLGETGAITLVAVAAELGAEPAALIAMRPWRAYLELSVRQIAQAGYAPGAGVERALRAEAGARGRSVRHITDVDQTLGAYARLADDDALDLLRWRLDDWAAQGEAFTPLFDAWTAGDAEAGDALMNAPMRAAAPAAFQSLVVARNGLWADAIADMLGAPGSALAVIGVQHLVGDGAIIEILRERGLNVERLGAE